MAKGGGRSANRADLTEARPKRKNKKARARARKGKGAPIGNGSTRPGTSSENVLAPESAAAGAGAAGLPHIPRRPFRVIEPPTPGLRRYFAEVWRHRSAFLYFVRRYARKRYGRTFFGYAWFFIPYILPLFVGALVFGGIIGVDTGPIPYFLYFVVALGTWLLFSQTAYFSTRSLEIVRNDVRRLYIPRLIPLMAAMTLPTIALLIYMILTVGTLGFYVLERDVLYLVLQPETLLVPVAFVMLLVFAWACALWFSPLAPRARDVRRLSGYTLGMWYFLTPVMYPVSQIPADYQFLAYLNPVTTPLEIVKEGLLDYGEVTTLGLTSYFVALVVASAVGFRHFLPLERRDVAYY